MTVDALLAGPLLEGEPAAQEAMQGIPGRTEHHLLRWVVFRVVEEAPEVNEDAAGRRAGGPCAACAGGRARGNNDGAGLVAGVGALPDVCTSVARCSSGRMPRAMAFFSCTHRGRQRSTTGHALHLSGDGKLVLCPPPCALPCSLWQAHHGTKLSCHQRFRHPGAASILLAEGQKAPSEGQFESPFFFLSAAHLEVEAGPESWGVRRGEVVGPLGAVPKGKLEAMCRMALRIMRGGAGGAEGEAPRR